MGFIDEYSILALAWCALAMACGGLIKGTLGVGTPLLTVPMMAMVLPAHHAVIIMAAPVVVANLWQVREAGDVGGTARRFWPAFIALLCGTWIGVAILKGIDEQMLLAIVGVLVICFTILQASPRKVLIPSRHERLAGVGFCSTSGIIGGLSSMFGPMLILYLVSLGSLNRHQFVATISFLYVAAVVPWTLIMLYVGILTPSLLAMSIAAVLPLVVGLVAGRAIRNRINEELFHRLVIGILLVSGAIMLWRAFGASL